MRRNTDILCQQVSKEKRIRLIKTDFQNIFTRKNSYAADEYGNVTGLNLSGQVLKDAVFLKECNTLQWLDLSNNNISDISILSHLENLAKVNLSQNRITDISCLRELKKLNWVNLRNNRISTLPTDILGWGMEIKWQSEHSTGIILAGNPLEKSVIRAIEEGRKALIEYFDKNVKIKISTEIPEDEPLQEEKRNTEAKRIILILAANPRNTIRLRLDKEVSKIEEGLKLAKQGHLFKVKQKWAVSRCDFQKGLLDSEAHIVHFIGHARNDGLLVEDEIGTPVRFSVEALSELFRLCSDHVKCVILSACYTISQADAINKYIDYVIGMQKEIEDQAAIDFAFGFYNALGSGCTIEKAFDFGRAALLAEYPDQRKHLIPILKKRGGVSNRSEIVPRSLDEENRDVFLYNASVDKVPSVRLLAGGPNQRGRNYWLHDSLVDWCLKLIFSDQYEGGNISGAWSKKYPEYLKILYGSDDSNKQESITFSCWIADALLDYQAQCADARRVKEIQVRIDRFYKYLLGHYDLRTGGFGFALPYSSGERKIVFDIRHTAWALLSLNRIKRVDRETDRMIRISCIRLAEEFENLNIQDEFPITISALHRLFSDENFFLKISSNTQIVHRKLKILELSLIEHFNDSYYCWGWFNDRAEKMSIDNALSVMYNFNYHSVIEEELKAQFKFVFDHLLEEILIELDGNKAALPFQKGGDADLGTTILFLYVLKKVGYKLEDTSRLNRLLNFINDPESTKKYTTKFSFPWHLATLFHLYDHEKGCKGE